MNQEHTLVIPPKDRDDKNDAHEQLAAVNDMTLGVPDAPSGATVSPLAHHQVSPEPLSTLSHLTPHYTAPTEVTPEAIRSVLSYLMTHPEQMPTWFRKHFVKASPETISAVLEHFTTYPHEIPAGFVIDLGQAFLGDRANDTYAPNYRNFDEQLEKQAHVTHFINQFIERIVSHQGMHLVPAVDIRAAVQDTLLLKYERQQQSSLKRAYLALTGRDTKPFEAITSQLEQLHGQKIALENAVSKLQALHGTLEERNEVTRLKGQQQLAAMTHLIVTEQAKRQEAMTQAYVAATETLLAIQQEALKAQDDLRDLKQQLERETQELLAQHNRFKASLEEERSNLTATHRIHRQGLQEQLEALESDVSEASIRATGAPARQLLEQSGEQILTGLRLYHARYKQYIADRASEPSKLSREFLEATRDLIRNTILQLHHIQELHGEAACKDVATLIEIELADNSLSRFRPGYFFKLSKPYDEVINRAMRGSNLKQVATAMERYPSLVSDVKESPRFASYLLLAHPELLGSDHNLQSPHDYPGPDQNWPGLGYLRHPQFEYYARMANLLELDILDDRLRALIPATNCNNMVVDIGALATLLCERNLPATALPYPSSSSISMIFGHDGKQPEDKPGNYFATSAAIIKSMPAHIEVHVDESCSGFLIEYHHISRSRLRIKSRLNEALRIMPRAAE